MTELDSLHNEGVKLVEPSDISGSLKGRSRIYSKLNSMIKNAEDNVVILTTKEGAQRKYKALKKSLTKAKANGVDVSIYSSFKESHKLANELKEFASVKDTNGLKSRMCVVDCSEVLLMLLDEDGAHEDSEVAVWLKAPFVASALSTLIKNT